MGRQPRHLPQPGSMVEVTNRTTQGRYLFRPDERTNELIVGVIARAQTETAMRIHALVFLSNHWHMLISPDSVAQMSSFMEFIGTNLSKEIGRRHDWPGSLFDRRFTSIPVSNEEQAQIGRLLYLLGQATKEDLVFRPQDWPGVHSISALTGGEKLSGIWVDRRRMHAARNRRQPATEEEFSSRMTVELSPLPCWQHLEPRRIHQRIRRIVRHIARETHERHRLAGTQPLGVPRIVSCHPHHRPKQLERRARPRFHAFRREARRHLEEALAEFVTAYRRAAERLRAGDRLASFPPDCHPPPLPNTPAHVPGT